MGDLGFEGDLGAIWGEVDRRERRGDRIGAGVGEGEGLRIGRGDLEERDRPGGKG